MSRGMLIKMNTTDQCGLYFETICSTDLLVFLCFHLTNISNMSWNVAPLSVRGYTQYLIVRGVWLSVSVSAFPQLRFNYWHCLLPKSVALAEAGHTAVTMLLHALCSWYSYYRLSHLTQNPPQQYSAAAAGNESVITPVGMSRVTWDILYRGNQMYCTASCRKASTFLYFATI
jgi:hypothetical protein